MSIVVNNVNIDNVVCNNVNITEVRYENEVVYKYVAPQLYRTMTMYIDQTNTNPLTSVTYGDDATGMTKGSSDWDDFIGHKPVLLDSTGNELGELNPNDFSKYKDGTSAPITTVGNDVMIKFPKRGLKISTDANNIITVSITDNPNAEASGFKYYAHSYGSHNNCDNVYVGVYKGYVSSNKLYSSSGKTPTTNQKLSSFRQKAEARGSSYEQMTFYVHTYIQAMASMKYGRLDLKNGLGHGYSKASAVVATGGTNASGMDFGSPSVYTSRVKCLGLEDLWGNIYEFRDGLIFNSTRSVLTSLYNTSFSDTGSGYTDNGIGASQNISSSIGTVQGTTETGFILKTTASSNEYNFSAYGAITANTYGCATVAGGYYDGRSNNNIYTYSAVTSTSTNTMYGSRLIKFDVAS